MKKMKVLCLCCCKRRGKRKPNKKGSALQHLALTRSTANESVLKELSYETYAKNYTTYIPLHTTVDVGDFFIIRNILGSGDVSIVFQATFIPTSENVAVKYIQDYSNHRKSIARELHVLGFSHHCPFLVKYHSHFRVRAKCYVITEQLSQLNFHQFLSPNLNLPPNLIKIYSKQLCKAVMFLHDHSIVHRDVTLNNLVLDHRGNLRLIDYNLCRSVTDAMGMRFSDLGASMYAAPEIYKDKLCSYPVDWWSVGVCLYRFTTGGYPYPTTTRRVYSYYVIKSHKVIYPREFFDKQPLRSLTENLLVKKSSRRLGTNSEEAIKRHAYFSNVDWDAADNVQEEILSIGVDELLWFKDAFRNMIPILDELMKGASTSEDMQRWSFVENIVNEKTSYGTRQLNIRKSMLDASV